MKSKVLRIYLKDHDKRCFYMIDTVIKHPEPVTNDDEFELLLSRSKIFQKNIFVLLEVLCCNFYKLPKFLPFYKRKVEKSKGGNQKYFLSILKASIIKKQD